MKRILLFAILSFILTQAFAQKRSTKGNVFPHFQELQKNVPRAQVQNVFRQYFSMTQADKLVLMKSESDQLGFVHEKFQQYYKNIKVDGATYTAHSKGGLIQTISGNYQGIKELDVSPAISKATAFNRATAHVNARIYAWDSRVKRGFPGYEKPTGELVIVSDDEKGIEPTLAFKFDIYSAEPIYRAWVFIDAKTGRYIKEDLRIHHANVPATANTRYNGNRSITADYTGTNYRLRQTAVAGVNGAIETYSLNNGTSYTGATDITSSSANFITDITANQAHWGAERTFDYFRVIHNRNSYNNAGAVIRSYVHYSTNYANAFWDGSRMTYGDGNATYGPLVSLDICGHEITHGVTEYSAHLVYSNQSGALNESFSDIFGECIEFHAKGTNDWLMSRDIGTAFRSMSNPNANGDPDTYLGSYWYTGTGDNGGVHTNSGVQNKWFYILTQGESGTNDIGNAYSVSGIGITDASKIAYRNLTVYLSSTSKYAAARTGAIQAAIDLFGPGSPQVIATTNAWYAVGVGCAYGVSCYCTSAGTSSALEYIKTVNFGSFSNTSGAAGYTNFTSTTIGLTAASANSVTLVPGFSGAARNEYWKIWIDFNKDGDFADAGEQVFANGLSSTTVSGTISIPPSATGSTRMRVSMKYNAQQTFCETFSNGEVEDYTVSFTPPAPDVTPPSAPVLTSTGTTQSTINLSWTAATDNVGVTGYDVYVNGVYNGSTSAATTFTVGNLTPATAYTIYLKAKDAAGNSTASNTIPATTQAAGPITIFGHYFESGLNGWADGGGDCSRYNGSRSYEGSYSIQLRDNAGTESAMTSAAYNVSSYKSLTLDFYFYSYGMENGEDVWLRYFNGSSWTTVATFVAGTHFTNNGFYHATVTLNNATFPSNAQFRIQSDASDNKDLIYVDAVVVKGSTNPALNNNNSQSIKLVSVLNTDDEDIADGIAGNLSPGILKLYPNPVVNTLIIDAGFEVKSARIYSSSGSLVKNTYFINGSINVSSLKPGLYVVKLQTVNGVITRKFIKQ